MFPARIPAQSADSRGLPSRAGGVSAVADAAARQPAAEQDRRSARPEILEASAEPDSQHWRVHGARFGRDASFQPFGHGVFRARVQVVDAEWVVDLPPDSGEAANSAFGQSRRAGTDAMLGMRIRNAPQPIEAQPSVMPSPAASGDPRMTGLPRLALWLYEAVAEGPAPPRSVDLFV
jgi:hypothetical protein